MKRFSFLVLLLVFFTLGCAHSPSPGFSPSSSLVSSQPASGLVSSDAGRVPLKSPEGSGLSEKETGDDRKNLPDQQEVGEGEAKTIADPPESLKASSGETGKEGKEKPGEQKINLQEEEEVGEEKEVSIADPLEPFNRAMFQFNDKLYFWVLKPVAQGYKKVVPEPARIGVKNFFSNLGFPARFVSSLLRADFKGAATQLGRFLVNTVWGVGGFLDPSSSEQLNIPKQEADLGQTLGIYGVGPGFYIVWPFLGPYSARDSIRIVGDYFLYPVSYITPWYDWLAVRAYEEVNDTSLEHR